MCTVSAKFVRMRPAFGEHRPESATRRPGSEISDQTWDGTRLLQTSLGQPWGSSGWQVRRNFGRRRPNLVKHRRFGPEMFSFVQRCSEMFRYSQSSDGILPGLWCCARFLAGSGSAELVGIIEKASERPFSRVSTRPLFRSPVWVRTRFRDIVQPVVVELACAGCVGGSCADIGRHAHKGKSKNPSRVSGCCGTWPTR